MSTLALATTAPTGAAPTPQTVPITIIRNGQPIEIEIAYALYLQLQEAIDDWQAAQRAAAAYEAYQKDPSRARPWEEFKAELIAEGLLDAE
ncbi:MAG: hypothetical protein E6Q97_26765 [Desulfurellales bacterium]|nr:MAG: hypothetical protein E6Q97_26765 [Desulfurellales bacterium]